MDTLVAGLRDETAGDPLSLSRILILLPTRRAARALREAFLRASGGGALLLPRMVPIGDLDEDEFGLGGLGDLGAIGGDAATEIPPAIPEMRRRLLLTRLVLEWGKARGTAPLLPGQAAMLARELERFLDETQSEGRDLAELTGLAPAEYAEHWQSVLQFLGILTQHWPAILAAEGCLDPAARRVALLTAQTAAWRRAPPAQRIIAAGLTGGLPALVDLLVTVANLPNGAVVLPGLDRELAPEDRALILDDPTHPQHLMARFLARLDIDAADIPLWPDGGIAGGPPERARLASEILRPAAATHQWRDLAAQDPAELAAGLTELLRLDCPGPQEEAGTIALLLRERLQHSSQTAALVTPDRDLARRVAGELRRWGIEIDDSAGQPLNRTPPGVFLRLVLDLAASRLAPVPLLAALKHPLARCSREPGALRGLIRQLEITVLRGPRPAPGFAGLLAAISAAAIPLRALLAELGGILDPLLGLLETEEVSLAALVAAHLRVTEALAADAEEPGAAQLWRGDAGEAAAHFFAELLAAAEDFPALRGGDYPALLESLLAGPVVRPRYGRHPRLAIWGIVEARLQQADLIILGGLNEGTWPADAAADPWLSRPMRRDFGLSPPERQIGIAAHDFAQALGAPAVVLTRASRVEGTPTVPSRWLLRLDTVLRAAGLSPEAGRARTLLSWQEMLDRPEGRTEIPAPAPRPPVHLRPRSLSVTEIETWMRDPYAIYAKHVLLLRALEPLDADPGAAEQGSLIHDALAIFVRRHRNELRQNALARLIETGRESFGAALSRPGVWAFWWPRFERIAQWFVATEEARRAALAASDCELTGRLWLQGPGGAFELICRADRIDTGRDGGLTIIDYKTGGVPDLAEVELGFAPQLPLEAAIAAAGGFAGLPPRPVDSLAYWRLSGGESAGEILPLAEDRAAVQALTDAALAGLRGLIERFDRLETPYRAQPRPDRAPRYGNYAHLARLKEWSSGGERE